MKLTIMPSCSVENVVCNSPNSDALWGNLSPQAQLSINNQINNYSGDKTATAILEFNDSGDPILLIVDTDFYNVELSSVVGSVEGDAEAGYSAEFEPTINPGISGGEGGINILDFEASLAETQGQAFFFDQEGGALQVGMNAGLGVISANIGTDGFDIDAHLAELGLEGSKLNPPTINGYNEETNIPEITQRVTGIGVSVHAGVDIPIGISVDIPIVPTVELGWDIFKDSVSSPFGLVSGIIENRGGVKDYWEEEDFGVAAEGNLSVAGIPLGGEISLNRSTLNLSDDLDTLNHIDTLQIKEEALLAELENGNNPELEQLLQEVQSELHSYYDDEKWKQTIEDLKEKYSDESSLPDDTEFILPEELPATGAEIPNIAAELEANMDLLYQNMNRFVSAVQGI